MLWVFEIEGSSCNSEKASPVEQKFIAVNNIFIPEIWLLGTCTLFIKMFNLIVEKVCNIKVFCVAGKMLVVMNGAGVIVYKRLA